MCEEISSDEEEDLAAEAVWDILQQFLYVHASVAHPQVTVVLHHVLLQVGRHLVVLHAVLKTITYTTICTTSTKFYGCDNDAL